MRCHKENMRREVEGGQCRHGIQDQGTEDRRLLLGAVRIKNIATSRNYRRKKRRREGERGERKEKMVRGRDSTG